MAFEHESGFPETFDRAVGESAQQSVVFVGDRLLQGAELNELQTIMRGRQRRFGNLLVKDGDRVKGGEALVDVEEGTVLLGDGQVYAGGDVLDVGPALLVGVPMTGRAQIGVRVVKTWLTHEADPNLLGQVKGAESEGEKGAAREAMTASWATANDGQPGDFVPVYELLEGTILDQKPPPALTGVQQQIADYDFDANGHYIVDGCDVACLGKVGPDWLYSIAAGTANVQGYKRIREAALRFAVPEEVDLEDVVAETHTYAAAGGAAHTVKVNRAPIASLTSAIIIKRVTQNIVRGAVPGTADDLQFNSATEIESIVQGGTTFAKDTSWLFQNGKIDWSPVGPEPAGSSTYSVTYLYSEEVTPSSITAESVTVSGGVQGKPITLRYLSKLPRIDLICMDLAGSPKYVKGISSRAGGLAPLEPTSLLKLAEVRNNWLTAPDVRNNGVRNFTYAKQERLFSRLVDMLDQFERQVALFDIMQSTPVSKKGIFTDTFVDDYFRDQGLEQSAAANRGVLQLAIDPAMLQLVTGQAETLPYTEMVIVEQPLRTSSVKINPYANFNAMPASMRLSPAVDFWTETQNQFTSDITREFSAAPDQPPGQTVINEVTEIRRELAQFLRQIDITITLEGFGHGEHLASLTFDGVDVKPAGQQTGDANGEITLTFRIPANIPAGTKLIRADGMSGSFAEASFFGEGTIDINVIRRVTLVTRAAPVPVINNITNITQVTNTTINQITQQVVRNIGVTDSGGDAQTAGFDPVAQNVAMPAPYMVLGLNFWFTAIGDRTNGVRVQLATVQNGYPTAVVLGEAFISMANVQVGQKVEARFDLPVYCAPGRQYSFVILTDDAEHSVAVAKLGDVIADTQERVGGSWPFTVGVMFTSADRLTWTAHQDMRLAFEIVAAKYTAATMSVDLWTGPLAQISDLMVRGAVELPTEEAAFYYELVRQSGEVIQIAPEQNIAFSEYLTETVVLRAVLRGNDRISPVLYPGTLIAGGSLRQTGTYVSRLFPFGSAVEVSALFAALLPAGSGAAVEVRTEGSAWQATTLDSTSVLGSGWVEPKYKRPGVTGLQGQIRVSLTGSPAARPSIARLRAYSI